MDTEFPLFRLPKLLEDDMICIDGIKRILVSQFVKSQEVKVSSGCISFLTLDDEYLHIKINNFKLSIEYLKQVSSYISVMFALGVKISCVLKSFVCAMRIVYYKNKWYVCSYKSLFVYNIVYGFKRIVRCKKIIIEPFLGSKCVILNVVLNKMGDKIIDIGDVINLSPIIALYFSNVLYVSIMYGLSKIIKSLVISGNNDNCCNNCVTIADIKSVSITKFGRYLINNLTCSYFYGLDLLTKGDLVAIWCKIISSKVIIKEINTGMQMVRGIGDMIVDVVNDFFKTLDLTKLIRGYLLSKVFVINNQLQAKIDELFNTSGLCQYSEQLNSLSLLSHKNRVIYTGMVGLSLQTMEVAIRNIYQ